MRGPNRSHLRGKRPLARWRLLRNMTQQQLAEASGVHRVSIARIELGAEPGICVALRLTDALGVRVEDVWTLDGSMPQALADAESAGREAALKRLERIAGAR